VLVLVSVLVVVLAIVLVSVSELVRAAGGVCGCVGRTHINAYE